MNQSQNQQLKTFRRVLTELADMAEHASLTGSLRGGEKQAAQAFNRALEALSSQGLVPTGMFEPINTTQPDFGELGVQCRLLLAAISDEPEERSEAGFGEVIALAPFLKSEDLTKLVRDRMSESTKIPKGLLVGLAPFLDSEMLGDLVRRQIRPPVPPVPPVAPEPPVAPPVPVEDLRPAIHVVHEIAEHHPETLESLAAQLREPDVSPEDRQRIATRLAELAYEQASRALE